MCAALVLSHRLFPKGRSRRRGSLRRATVPGQKLREHERDGKKTTDKRDGDHEKYYGDQLAARHRIAWSFEVTAPTLGNHANSVCALVSTGTKFLTKTRTVGQPLCSCPLRTPGIQVSNEGCRLSGSSSTRWPAGSSGAACNHIGSELGIIGVVRASRITAALLELSKDVHHLEFTWCLSHSSAPIIATAGGSSCGWTTILEAARLYSATSESGWRPRFGIM